MKKMIIIIEFVFLLICIGLSGCNEKSNKINSEIKITNVLVTTYWSSGGLISPQQEFKHIGFYHDAVLDANNYNIYYEIQGTVVNNAGKSISLKIITKLYDADNNLLWTDYDLEDVIIIYDIPNMYSKNFVKNIYQSDIENFDKVENCIFEFELLEI